MHNIVTKKTHCIDDIVMYGTSWQTVTHDHVHYKSLLTIMAIVSVFEVVVTIMVVVGLGCKHKQPSTTSAQIGHIKPWHPIGIYSNPMLASTTDFCQPDPLTNSLVMYIVDHCKQ